ncbi:MAG: ABC transporter substrate-binding protein [Streptosporangiaceae bacterium]
MNGIDRVIARRGLILGGTLAVTLTLGACAASSPASTPSGSTAPGITRHSIRIGTSNALTGPVASVCLPTSAGSTAWFDHVNALGGVHGRAIDDTVLDDGYQAPRAAANVATFRSGNVFALFGGCGTVTAATIASVVRGTSMPYLFPYAALPALVSPTQPNVYSLLPLYNDQARSLIPYVLGHSGTGSVYALTTEIPGFQDDVNGASDGTRRAGATFLGSALLPVANAPFQVAALKASAAKPDYLMLTVLAPDAARIINAMAAAGKLPAKGILGVSVLASQNFAAALTPAAAALLQTASPTVPVGDPRAAQCIDALRKYQPSVTPDAFALYGCAAAQVFVAAMQEAGANPTRTSLEKALDSFSGAAASPLLPPVSFSAGNHMGLHSMFLLSLKDGKFSIAGALPITAAPGN